MSDRAFIKILLNRHEFGWDEYADQYSEFDTLNEAHTFWSGLPACGVMERLLRIIFEQLNRPDDCRAEWAQDYFRKGNRCLSVGDVICVGEIAYAVKSEGFGRVSVTPEQIREPVVDLGHPRHGR